MSRFREPCQGVVSAGSIGRFVRGGGPARGTLPAGNGTWEFRAGVLTVEHDRPVPLLLTLIRPSDPPGRVRYPVRLLAPAAAPHKPRRWWACPGCGRKCSKLYLAAPRPALACRGCHGFTYDSQYASRSARAFKRQFNQMLDDIHARAWEETFGTPWPGPVTPAG